MNRKKPTETGTSEVPEAYAEPIPWEPAWDAGAPMPHVYSNGHNVYLIYLMQEHDPNWDGTYVNVIENRSDQQYPLALVTFQGGTFRFGIANDEVWDGLPLANKGLEPYAAHVVHHSPWIRELHDIHRVHPYYSPTHWQDRKHYLLLFHDELLEVIATGYTIETFHTSFYDLAQEVVKRMHT